MVSNAMISMIAGTTEYAAKTGSDGNYSLRISNIYDNISDLIEVGTALSESFLIFSKYSVYN